MSIEANPRMTEVLDEIHAAVLRKTGSLQTIRDDILLENRVFAVLCENYDMGPNDCSVRLNERYGYDLNGNHVIQVFRSRKVANPVERKELLVWADSAAVLFPKVLSGDKAAFEAYETIRKAVQPRNTRRHRSQGRILAIMLFERYPELNRQDDADLVFGMGDTLGKYLVDDISDAICHVYGFAPQRSPRQRGAQNEKKASRRITYEQAIARIEQLEATLDRTNLMLQELQDEFDEQLMESKIKEMTDFFARLNSERYGCILDELLEVRKGADQLRKSGYQLPLEINGILIMTSKLIRFVKDSHIDPMMKLNAVLEVKAADVEFCNYEGTPFLSPEDSKRIRVLSPGWIYRDKEIQISRPKVKEE
ncbi:MAG: hypothetical protein IKE58_03235 [Blautia sp.]|nr:hypothetical protein [Blautia sp.]